MTRTDNLYIKSSLTPEDTAKLFFKSISRKVKVKQEKHLTNVARYVKIPEFVAYIASASPDHRSDIIKISPTVKLTIHPNKEIDWDIPKVKLIYATINLIQQHGFDTYLELMDATVTALIYQAGKLTLNSRQNIWKPDYLKFVTIPYDWQEMPTP